MTLLERSKSEARQDARTKLGRGTRVLNQPTAGATTTDDWLKSERHDDSRGVTRKYDCDLRGTYELESLVTISQRPFGSDQLSVVDRHDR